MRSILSAAADAWRQNGRSGQPLLFGQTLAAILVAALEALSGNILGLVNNQDIIGQFVNALLEKASGNPAKFGSRAFCRPIR